MGKVTDVFRDTVANAGGALGIGDKAKPDVSGYAPSASESAFTQALLNQYNGQGPSAAALQLQQGLDQSNSNAVALAASQRGVSPALAAQLAAREQAANQQSTNQQAGILRAQEQLGAAGTLAGLFGSQRQSASAADALQAQTQAAQGKAALGLLSMGASSYGLAKGAGGEQSANGGGPMGAIGANGQAENTGYLGAVTAFAHGGFVPGQAAVKGNSVQNDKVPAMLSPKEIVLPRSVTLSKNAPEKAKDFVAHIMDRKDAGDKAKDRPKSYGELMEKHRALEARIKKLEKKG